ncbi:MAG TPA: SDR family NAD(P)-dependent oxidoreductase [Fibrobacteria bacterium]|nr:SDR family NAD(P)-dependent oxidoreductase [Fibrobacteria bacterium]
MDPQQRLFLETCWHGLENAGYNPKSLSGSRCGVFVGCSGSDYLEPSRERRLSAQGFTGAATSILAARISFFLDLQGPCLSIDTACSSSLVAIANACDSLCAGGSDAALAGGVFVMSGPSLHIMASQAGMLSPDGRCYSFDQRANGFVPGEGVGVLVLKRLADAERDRDPILGVIQGWGVNQDGKTNGITAPNPESQARLEMEVYDRHGIDPSGIQLVEAHGTGTKLGDPIEVEALKKSFRKYTRRTGYCALGSVKSNIGHCLTAAGVSGVIKVLLAMKHRQLPPTINFDRLNEHLALQDSPFFVNRSLQEWAPAEGGRRAAVSSFGFSGTNAHLVLSEYAAPLPAGNGSVVLDNGKYAVPLSARTAEQLQEAARGLLAALRRDGASLDLPDLAYTLQTGRDSLGERLGFMADSIAQLIAKLEAYLGGDTAAAYRGQVQANKEGMRLLAADDIQAAVVENFLARKKIGKLLDLWVKGLAFDWNRLYAGTRLRRIPLPVYPFARERYWIGNDAGYGNESGIGNINGTIGSLHPLLHRNVSDLAGQAYATGFAGHEPFLQAGTGGGSMLSPMAFVEMARAALEDALPAEASGPVLELRDLAWEAPLAVQAGREAVIRLSVGEAGQVRFEVGSRGAGEGEPPDVHFRGEGVCLDASDLPALDIAALDVAGLEAAGGLTVLGLGEGDAHPAYVLPPAILDGVLRACMSRCAGPDGLPDTRLGPATLASLRVSAPCPRETLAWVRPAGSADPNRHGPAFDVDLCDRAGAVCASLRGLALSAGAAVPDAEAADAEAADAEAAGAEAAADASAWDGISYACDWEAQPAMAAMAMMAAGSHAKVLIACFGPSFRLETALLEHYRNMGSTDIRILRFSDRTERASEQDWLCESGDAGSLARCLEGMEAPDALYFLALDGAAESASMREPGDAGPEVHLLRLAKHLKQGAGGRIDTYVLTLDAQGPQGSESGSTGPRGAAAAGLGYSLAQGSSRFQVRNLDLSARDLGTPESRRELVAALLREPASDRGEIFRLRAGRRYRQAFFPLKWDAPDHQALRQEGVYLIVGGSGIVGRTITRELIRKYRATVIWTGRSAEDSDKVRKALASAGERVAYVQADATDPAAMRRAVETIKRGHGRIDGAVFAGMVFDFGNSVDQTTEAEFRAIAEVKIKGSRAVFAALAEEPLDFLCYFSSGQAFAFSGAAQLSAYSAGIVAADSFARSLRGVSAFPVGIINWGFWKASVAEIKAMPAGVSMDNLDALEDREGFACFERFVNELGRGRLHQVLGMRASPQIEALMHGNREEAMVLAGGPAAHWGDGRGIRIAVPSETIGELKRAGKQAALEAWFIRLLHAQVVGMLGDAARTMPQTADALRSEARVLGKYSAWWAQALRLLADAGCVDPEGGLFRGWSNPDDTLRDAWRIQKGSFQQDPDCRALAGLVDDCLVHLPDILQGRTLATDIVFPDSSMAKVEGVYRDNAVCDVFNGIVADTAAACARSAGAQVPPVPLRILEIGAGTGGTSALVFAKLRPYRDAVGKYTYTDLSKAFLFHAEKTFAPDCPYLECRLLDVERPLEPQGIGLGGHDMVIATNVLHATRNIRRTLRNAKAALRQGGMLVLNEMSRDSLSTHLTFGLLDGWWLFEDPELRIPGCPGLAPESWQRVLEEEGFRAVAFPAREGHGLGNQVIVAFSDGIIRQPGSPMAKPVPFPTAPAIAATAADPAVPAPAPAPVAERAPTPAAIAEPRPSAPAATAPAGSALVLPGQALPGIVQSQILACLCGVLKIAPGIVRPDAAFSDYGVDSILGVNFIKQVNERLGINLNTAVIFDYASLEALSRHVATAYREQVEARLRSAAPAAAAAAATSATPAGAVGARPTAKPVPRGRRMERPGKAPSAHPEIAVIGLSGMAPKSEDARAYWKNLSQGVSCIEALPARYLDPAYYSPRKQAGKTRCKWGGILEKRDCFDPLFFNISPKEAESMNPHQRLVMQESWKAIEDAGYDPRKLAGSQTGIFVGAEPTGYVGESFTGFSDAIVASRLSYFLNLNGPAFVVNTGCSSSAVALHLACESLRHGETELALAGGVNAAMSHYTQVRLDEIEMLSPTGRCLAFDGEADGTVISEGVGMVVLKRLEDAVAAGDPIHAVISGSGINQDGASNGITAPNGAAQEKLISAVYRKFGIDPSRIGYVEAHGTGTKLGDPVEANALIRAFRGFTSKQGYCALGTAKANIGHTAAAAGVLGLIKVIFSLRNRRIPALPGLRTVNPLIELEGSPFRINTHDEEWKADGGPRMAALNSFGHSGTNAHLVIREYLPPIAAAAPAPVAGQGAIFPLSAKTPEQLREKARGLLDWLRSPELRDPAAGPLDVAYTLQAGREPMEERVGFIADSLDQLAGKLQAWLEGTPGSEGMARGTVKRKPDAVGLFGQDEELREAVGKWIARNKLPKLLEAWIQGLDLDWDSLYRGSRPRRVRLPTYPFAQERYWTQGAGMTPASGDAVRMAPAAADLGSVEDILKDVDEDAIDTEQALILIKNLV